jgi:hypothetical protein
MTQTIEKTGKEYKAAMVIAWVIILSAPILFFSDHGVLALVALIIGVVADAAARIGAWWNHG